MISEMEHDEAFDYLTTWGVGDSVVVLVRDRETDGIGGVRVTLKTVGPGMVTANDSSGREWLFHRSGPAYCTNGVALCGALVDMETV